MANPLVIHFLCVRCGEPSGQWVKATAIGRSRTISRGLCLKCVRAIAATMVAPEANGDDAALPAAQPD
ncbi:MAG: hypothetical protein AB7Q97_18590 [Gammaproteobacteria bacterium]